ncbi:hypothetical protein SBADM41S_09256 [Streptomyces badius]
MPRPRFLSGAITVAATSPPGLRLHHRPDRRPFIERR